MTPTTTQRRLDLRGKTITTYLAFELHQALAPLAEGEQVRFVTDAYPAIDADIRAWCRATGSSLTEADVTGDEWTFTVEKGTRHDGAKKFALVISDDGLLELLSPLAFALAAALEGHQVSLYAQGPAVRILAKGYTARIHGIGRPFSRFARRGMAKSGHVPPQVKIAELLELGARIFVCAGSMDHYKVAVNDFAFEGLEVVEYLTFMEEMASANIHMYV